MISLLLRKLGLLRVVDYARFWYFKLKNRKRNLVFRQHYPSVALPPDYLMYESFQLDYEKYYLGGRQTAQWVWEQVAPFLPSDSSGLKILDWGCGPARVVRHLPDLVPPSTKIFATDYNQNSIEWNHSNLLGISFGINQLSPPLNFPDQTFHLVYAISIFTHLSEENHKKWMQEIQRILVPEGIFFFTTQGINFLGKLTPNEKRKFEKENLIIRDQVLEGHRTYSAFHPPEYIKNICSPLHVIKHQTPKIQNNKALPQDIWIIKKPAP